MRELTRRETRSQTANAKTEAYVEYAPPHAKRKITIFRDDLLKLNEGEFLNDTIIEFYLMYLPPPCLGVLLIARWIMEELDEGRREECHFFNTFFWTNLTKKNVAG
jgi:Ulp1 family protease